MRTVTVRRTSLRTSQLGFGCAALTAGNDRRAALQLLASAHDSGICHFDVARAYGFGQAEGILGEFIADRRERVTVTTKFGMQPPASIAGHPTLISLAKRVLRRFPPLDRVARRRAQQLITGGTFDVPAARASLERSLRELRTDYVDLLLMHECTMAEASDETLLRFLEDELGRGTVRAYGVGTAANKLPRDAALIPIPIAVVQLPNSAVEPNRRLIANLDQRGVIAHSPFKHMQAVLRGLASDSALAKRARSEVGIDPKDASAVGACMIRYAANDDADGIVIFSSGRADHIRANIRALDEPFDGGQLDSFAHLARDAVAVTRREISGRGASVR